MSYVTGKIIKELREKNKFTQKQLADMLQISDKTVSKWETDRGLPDIGLISNLAEALGVTVEELLTGEYVENGNLSANMKKIQFYVCPICGNVIQAVGKGVFSCHGILLPVLEIEDEDENHRLEVDNVENEYYLHLDHPMTKKHYISFVVYLTSDHVEFKKLYPEQNLECRVTKRGHGFLFVYCNIHGLYRFKV